MTKFGLFNSRSHRPIQHYEGDRIIQYVQVIKDHPGNNVELVATVKLDEGQVVKKILHGQVRQTG